MARAANASTTEPAPASPQRSNKQRLRLTGVIARDALRQVLALRRLPSVGTEGAQPLLFHAEGRRHEEEAVNFKLAADVYLPDFDRLSLDEIEVVPGGPLKRKHLAPPDVERSEHDATPSLAARPGGHKREVAGS